MESYHCIQLTYERDPDIAVITLDRAEKMNALNQELLGEFSDALEKIRQNEQVKGVIIAGSGKLFCAGADIQQFLKLNGPKGLAFAQHGQALFRSLELLGKPSIAAIQGGAHGGGCELAMAATLRIAADNAKFSQPEVKLGVIPGFGGTQRLSRIVGKGRALDLCMTGRSITAEEALHWGLVSDVTTPEQLLPSARAMMREILSRAPLAVKSVMAVIDAGFDLPLDEALKIEALHFALLCDSKDKQEGATAFLEKREPKFLEE